MSLQKLPYNRNTLQLW